MKIALRSNGDIVVIISRAELVGALCDADIIGMARRYANEWAAEADLDIDDLCAPRIATQHLVEGFDLFTNNCIAVAFSTRAKTLR